MGKIKEEVLEKENKEVKKDKPIEKEVDKLIETKKEKDSEKSILKEDKPEEKSNKALMVTTILVLIVVFLLAFSTVFALANSTSNKIIPGTYIKGINVSGLTREEATEKVSKEVNKKINDDFNLIYVEEKTALVPEQFGAKFDVDKSVATAFQRGRGNNIFINNYEIIVSFLFKTDIITGFSYNEEFIDNLIAEIQEKIPDKLEQPSYVIEDDKLIVSKGINGYIVDKNTLKLKLISNISDLTIKNQDIEVPLINSTADKIDLDKIYEEIHKEPKDAYFTKDPFTVYPAVVGVDFAISMDEAKKLLEEDKETYTIPLKLTEPKVTTAQIGSEAFPNLLSTFSTTYSTRNVNRSTNIRLAASKINGKVLMPGETFSYNSTVGKRTAAAGFKEAAVYAGGEVTTGIGGGICQVSSTLYNSVLLANLQIVERHNHGFNPGYVAAGRDATVSWGGPDFKFKNSRNFPIKIEASGSGGTILIKIYGMKENNEYDVEIQSYITSYIPYKVIEQKDGTLAAGETKVIESGSNGCRSVCYRILKQNGAVVSKTLLSSDTYSPHNRIVRVGTASSSTTEATTPAETTTPTSPSTPTTPTEPTTPSTPTEPTTPAEPTEPTEPTNPAEPTEPTEPTNPTEPTEPTNPTDTTLEP